VKMKSAPKNGRERRRRWMQWMKDLIINRIKLPLLQCLPMQINTRSRTRVTFLSSFCTTVYIPRSGLFAYKQWIKSSLPNPPPAPLVPLPLFQRISFFLLFLSLSPNNNHTLQDHQNHFPRNCPKHMAAKMYSFTSPTPRWARSHHHPTHVSPNRLSVLGLHLPLSFLARYAYETHALLNVSCVLFLKEKKKKIWPTVTMGTSNHANSRGIKAE
jgi:hypothetical protein